MTKTLNTVDSYRIANPGLPETVLLSKTVDGSFVWDLAIDYWKFHERTVLM
jgi:hypothetical protein